VIQKAQAAPKRLVFPEGEERKILRACHILADEGIARPVLLGHRTTILAEMEELRFDPDLVTIVDPTNNPNAEEYADLLYSLRNRKGVTRREAKKLIRDPNMLGALMVRSGFADGVIAGLTQHYPDTIRPALQVLALREGVRKVAGCYILITPSGDLYFLADTTVNIEPSAEDLADIAILTAETARRFDVEPRVALLSFSNFGSVKHPLSEKVRRAVSLLLERAPGLVVDGEMHADVAVDPEMLRDTYSFSRLKKRANVLIFPNLEAGNIAYKLLSKLGGAETIGPILMGLSGSVHVLQLGAEVADVVNMAAVAVVEAQGPGTRKLQPAVREPVLA
jgi:malate dehydrogenase (oxaloacetate-decarboxylating)(NADP+)